MTWKAGRDHLIPIPVLLALALVAGAGSLAAAPAQSAETPKDFWHIPVWAQPGAWQDNTALFPRRCGGSLDPRPDSLRQQPRTVTVRFLRNRRAEARPDFGGYRVYRCTNSRDTTTAVLLRRYSVLHGDEPLWHFSRVDTTHATLPFMCGGAVVHDSILTFVDPDSSGALGKVCRDVDHLGRCLSKGDSVWALLAVPGPHDGFRTWYTVTYQAQTVLEPTYEELFIPDTSDTNNCGPHPWRPENCPNLNSKLGNMILEPVAPTGGPTANLQTVAVVPNPFRSRESWDLPNGHEVHFINLPPKARIRIYTVAGDLVRELAHDDTVPVSERSDLLNAERWDLKNTSGKDVSSGIYMYRVESGPFAAQDRFIVIR
jgi:hypothetical protein